MIPMKKCFLVSCLFFGFSGIGLLAQNVVLTRAIHGLDANHVNKMKMASYVEPGPSGEKQVWDLSGMQGEKDFSGSVRSAFEVDGENNFPESNVVLNEGCSQFYFYQDDDALRAYGMATASGNVRMTFHRPYVKMIYPFAFGDTFEGEYDGTYHYSEGKQAGIAGAYRVEADAFGSLILPGGHKVSDVLRVVSVRSYDILLGTPNRNEITTFRWYARNERFPLAVLTSYSSTACGQGNISYQAAYRIPTTDKKEPAQALPGLTHISIYPNPVENHFTIDYSLHSSSHVLMDMYDNTGKKITTLVEGERKAGAHKEYIELERYSMYPGLYFVRCQIGEQIESISFVLAD
jgi:hypothetical protein